MKITRPGGDILEGMPDELAEYVSLCSSAPRLKPAKLLQTPSPEPSLPWDVGPTLEDRVLEVLRSAAVPLRARELRARVAVKMATLITTLRSMQGVGTIVKTDQGFELPEPSDETEVGAELETEVESMSESQVSACVGVLEEWLKPDNQLFSPGDRRIIRIMIELPSARGAGRTARACATSIAQVHGVRATFERGVQSCKMLRTKRHFRGFGLHPAVAAAARSRALHIPPTSELKTWLDEDAWIRFLEYVWSGRSSRTITFKGWENSRSFALHLWQAYEAEVQVLQLNRVGREALALWRDDARRWGYCPPFALADLGGVVMDTSISVYFRMLPKTLEILTRTWVRDPVWSRTDATDKDRHDWVSQPLADQPASLPKFQGRLPAAAP